LFLPFLLLADAGFLLAEVGAGVAGGEVVRGVGFAGVQVVVTNAQLHDVFPIHH
jgi:hypothetical protein